MRNNYRLAKKRLIHIKTLSVFIALAIIFALTGCKENTPAPKSGGNNSGGSVKTTNLAKIEETPGNMFTIINNGANITITKYIGNAGIVRIPEKINGLPVTEIGDGAFANSRTLREVYVPNGVNKIGNGAFSNCPNLTKYLHSGYPFVPGRIFQFDGYLWRIIAVEPHPVIAPDGTVTYDEYYALFISEDLLYREKYHDDPENVTDWVTCKLNDDLNNRFFLTLIDDPDLDPKLGITTKDIVAPANMIPSLTDMMNLPNIGTVRYEHLKQLITDYNGLSDNLFLLSVYEATYYIFANNSSFPQLKKAYEHNSPNAYSWWLRHTTETGADASFVAPHVYYDDTGVSAITLPDRGYNVNLFVAGVRPAMWIKLP